MRLYLYKIDTKEVVLTFEDVVSYTDSDIILRNGAVNSILLDCLELSSLPDCSETLRADWRAAHPTAERRLEELETLMAELLFGGEAV